MLRLASRTAWGAWGARWARAARRRPPAAAAAAALALALLAAGARVLSPPHLSSAADFPRVRPADLAHLLADVSTHTLIPSPWSLEEEAGNYTTWRYVVAYACGARCAGRASLSAHALAPAGALGAPRHGAGAPGAPRHGAGAPGAPRHGAGSEHRVRVLRSHCRTLPLLPWPQLCEEIETDWLVTGTGEPGGGARLQEESTARCGALAAVLLQCAAARDLRDARAAQLRRLRGLLRGRGGARA